MEVVVVTSMVFPALKGMKKVYLMSSTVSAKAVKGPGSQDQAKDKEQDSTSKCHTRGAYGHRASQCPARGACWAYGQQGHHAANCPSKGKGEDDGGKNGGF